MPVDCNQIERSQLLFQSGLIQEAVLSLAGPRFVNGNRVGDDLFLRRVGNIYYTKEFAEQIFQEIMLHHAKA